MLELKIISENSKIGEQIKNRYKYSNMKTIFDAYKNPSQLKIDSYNKLVEQCECEGGGDIRIVAKNCQSYSLAYRVCGGLRYETKDYSYLII